MHRNQYSQIRPASVSSALNKQQHHNDLYPLQKPLHTQRYFAQSSNDPVFLEKLRLKIQNEGSANWREKGSSRRGDKQVLHFRYINRVEQMRGIVENGRSKNDWQERILLLYRELQKLQYNWEVIGKEIESLSTEYNSNQNQINENKKYKQALNKISTIFKQLASSLTSKEISLPLSKFHQKQNMEEKEKEKGLYFESYIQNLQNQNINLCAQVNQNKQKLQKHIEKQEQLMLLVQEKEEQMKKYEQSYLKQIKEQKEEIEKKNTVIQQLQSNLNGMSQSFQIKQKEYKQQLEEINSILQEKNVQIGSLQKKIDQMIKQTEEYEKYKEEDLKEKENWVKEREELERQKEEFQQKKQYFQKREQEYRIKEEERNSQKKTNWIQSAQMEKYHQYYEQKIHELTQIAKDKEEKIKNLKDVVAKQEKKISEISDNYISQKQLQILHKKIENYQNVLLTEGGTIYDKVKNQTHDYFNGKVFEDQIIYELKKDNQKLLEFIDKNDVRKYFGRSLDNKIVIEPSSGLQAIEQTISLVEDALYKLNKIIENVEQVKEESPKKGQKGKKIKLQVGSDLSILKIYFININQFCSKCVKILKEKENERLRENRKNPQKRHRAELLNLDAEKQAQLTFYKNENKKLDERIGSLLSINSKLKDQLTKKSPQKKVSNEIYWKAQAQNLQTRLTNLQKKYKKAMEERNEMNEKIMQEESQSAFYASEIQRLKSEQERNQTKLKKGQETIMIQLREYIEILEGQKGNMEKELALWVRKQKQSEWKLSNLLDEISQLHERNGVLETKLKETEVLYHKINELQMKLIELNNEMAYSAPSSTQHSYITTFTYEQLCTNIERIKILLNEQKNSILSEEIGHNTQLCLKILNSIKPMNGKVEKQTENPYFKELVKGFLSEVATLIREIESTNERDMQIREIIDSEIRKCWRMCKDFF